ncbi:MAG: hypothetical protein ACE5RC_00050 [Nitrosopumilus sp.]
MKYGISCQDRQIISDCKKNFGSLSIFVLMRRLKCTPEKAAFIIKEYFNIMKGAYDV